MNIKPPLLQSYWTDQGLTAFLNIQLIFEFNAWQRFSAQALSLLSKQIKADLPPDSLTSIDVNLDILRMLNLPVWVEIKDVTEELSQMSFREMESYIEPYRQDNVKWWPGHFQTLEQCNEWITEKKKSYISKIKVINV